MCVCVCCLLKHRVGACSDFQHDATNGQTLRCCQHQSSFRATPISSCAFTRPTPTMIAGFEPVPIPTCKRFPVFFTAGWGVLLCNTNRSYGLTVDSVIGSTIGSTQVSARKQATHFAARSEMVGKRLWSTIHSTNRMVRSVSAQEVHETASSHGGA